MMTPKCHAKWPSKDLIGGPNFPGFWTFHRGGIRPQEVALAPAGLSKTPPKANDITATGDLTRWLVSGQWLDEDAFQFPDCFTDLVKKVIRDGYQMTVRVSPLTL